jgi:hypothetical protein
MHYKGHESIRMDRLPQCEENNFLAADFTDFHG